MTCLNLNEPTIKKLVSKIGYNTLSQIIEYNGIEILDIIKEKPFIDLKDELRKSYEYQLNNKKFNDSIDNMNEISFWRMFTPSFYNWFGDWMIQYKLQNGLQLSEKEQDVLATKYEGSYDRLKADISKVVTDDGLPKLVYHSSLYNFVEFKNRDYIHFGTEKAAFDRLDTMIGRLPFTEDNQFNSVLEEQLNNIPLKSNAIPGITVKSYFLNIKKLIPSEDVIAGWTGKVWLKDENSGIEYINKLEDKGSVSYAIRDINQTKSAILPDENISSLLIDSLVKTEKITPNQAKQLIPTKFLNPTNSEIMYFQRLNGGTYGFITPDGKVFIDKSTQSLNTPFHEFYHIYDKIILSNYNFDSRAKSIIDRANQLAIEGGYLDKVKQLNAYKDDDEEQQLAEARAMLIGDASSSKINEAEHGFLMKLKALLKDLVDYILDIIGTKSFKNYTPEQILNMTMEEFTNVMTHDMLYDKSFGKHLTPEQRQNIQELKDLEPAYAQASDEEVQEFIESIYPESQIKDIVWHGTNTQLDLNTKPKQRNFEFTKGFHFDYIYKKAYMWGKNVIPAIVDVRNPYEIKRTDDIEYARDRYMKSDYLSALAINDYDPNTDESTMYKDGIIKKHDTETGGEYLNVASKKQITILNSPETIQKFQEFLDRKKYNGIHITLGRSAQRSFGKVQNIIISYNGKEITSQDNVPGLGEMNVIINNNEVYVGNIRLPLEYQGKGLAKHIYQAVADKLQLPVVNSKERGQEQSESGGYVWKNRTVFLPNSKKNKTNFQDLTPIKPGVEELFDSNPELANAIYEALGFDNQKDTVRLYRIENKNIPYDESREGIVSKKEIVGGFFTNSVDTVANYIRKNQSQEGINLVYVDIPKHDLDNYHVSKNEYAKDMDVESDNWIIPSNIKRNYVDISSVSKVTGNFMTLSKAKQELKSIINNLPTFEITPQQKQQALQLYSQYLDSLNKPNTNPILQGNQQEQVKKFIELQERLNNKEFLEGAKNVFESTSALQELGTQKEYNDYIARVSLGIIKNPSSGEYNYTSKVKDIVYRGLSNKSDNSIKEDSYWTQYITLAYDYIDRQQSSWENGLLNKYDNPEDIPIEEWNSFEGVLQQAIVNIKKPFMDKEGLFSLNKKEGYDASIGNVKDVLGEEPQILIYKPEQIHILGSKQDIEGFKEFIEKETNNIQFQDLSSNQVNYSLKAISIISNNLPTINKWFKQLNNTDLFWNKVQQNLQIPKNQIELLKNSEGNTIEEKLLELASNYSYTVEINTAKEKEGLIKDGTEFKVGEDYYYSDPNRNVYKIMYSKDNGGGSKDISKQEFENARQNSKPTAHYSSLTVPGGTNYTENEIATPAITPSIKGHAQFATDNGIGWFRSDDVQTKNDLQRELYTQNFTFEELLQRGEIKQVPCE